VPTGPKTGEANEYFMTGRIELGPTDRTTIVGRTGSGKTTLALTLVGGYRALVIIDPKWRITLARTITVLGSAAEFAQVYPQRSTRVIYRPDPENKEHGDVDDVIRRVLAYGRTCLEINEAMGLSTPQSILPSYMRAMTQGRELYVPVVSETQRPTGIHNVILSEAEHVFIFDLAVGSDRKKLGDIVGDSAQERVGRPFAFKYAGPGTAGDVIDCEPIRLPGVPSAPQPPRAEAAQAWSDPRSGTSSS